MSILKIEKQGQIMIEIIKLQNSMHSSEGHCDFFVLMGFHGHKRFLSPSRYEFLISYF